MVAAELRRALYLLLRAEPTEEVAAVLNNVLCGRSSLEADRLRADVDTLLQRLREAGGRGLDPKSHWEEFQATLKEDGMGGQFDPQHARDPKSATGRRPPPKCGEHPMQ